MSDLISPIDCKHYHHDLIDGSRKVSTDEHSRHYVYLCLDCGQFRVVGMINDEHYNYAFTLVRDEHLEAASKAVKYYSQED